MMHIAKLRLKNFGIFRGEHELELGETTYALVAGNETDHDKSNGSGKTTLLEAVGFALWGRHRHRSEDAWISRGEGMGEVELGLSDGTRIVRSRARGKSTKLFLFPAGNAAGAMIRDEAEKRLVEVVGLGEEDYFATRHLEQRQVARFLLVRPEERMQAVSAWVGLGPLERCEDAARLRLEQAATEALRAEERRSSASQRLKTALGEHTDRSAFKDARDVVAVRIAKLRSRVEAREEAYRANEEALADAAAVDEYEGLVIEGKKLRAEVDAFPATQMKRSHEGAKEAERAAAIALGQAQSKVRQLAAAARGAFDGRCPVAEVACPIKAGINGMRAENRLAHEAAMATCDAAHVAVREAAKEEVDLDTRLQAHARASQRLQDLRARALRLQPAAERGGAAKAEERATLRSRLDQARDELEAAVADAAQLAQAIEQAEIAEREVEKATEEAKVSAERVAVARAALLVLGRSGAQRRVAEGALGQIEAIANDSLAACGEDLRVAVAWAREGQGLASACDACGAPYPSSTKIKACSRCGGERGPKLVHRLDLDLSDRSGGLEDLAGCALALAAGSWLSRARGASWGTALLDEPMAALDQGRRRALMRGLPAMLVAGGITQAIVVAHTAASMDALPARIRVIRKGAWSEVSVE